MRWIVLALSLGAMIVSLIQGVMFVLMSSGDRGVGPFGEGFTWMTTVLLLLSVVIALTGAVLAFNRRKAGGIFIIVAALICLLAHSNTRIFGGIYLVAGLLAFAVKSSSEYEYEDDEFDDISDFGDDDDEDEEEEEEKTLPARSRGSRREESQELSYGGRRRERASAIKMDREELSMDGIPRIGESRRSSKVCPKCGASTGIDHKFCYTCGEPLHTMKTADPDFGEPDVETPLTRKISSAFKDFKMVSPMDELEEEDDDDEDEDFQDEGPEKPMSHRVFIKSSGEDEEEEFDPFMIEPDDSYQEFSRYTNRRKKKRTSTLRRILAPLVLLLAIGGSAWLLLGPRGEVQLPPPPPPPNGGQRVDPPPPPPPSPLELLEIRTPTRGIVTGGNVNIRPSNAATGTVVARLTAGARAEIIDQRPGPAQHPGMWFNIRFNARTGWIYGQFFQALDGRQATLPDGYTHEILSYFGMSRHELIAQLGQPTQTSATAMTWNGLTAEFSGDDVLRLQITGRQHALANGLSVGMTEAELYNVAGHPSDFSGGQLLYIEESFDGTRRGMAVRLHEGHIQSITAGNI